MIFGIDGIPTLSQVGSTLLIGDVVGAERTMDSFHKERPGVSQVTSLSKNLPAKQELNNRLRTIFEDNDSVYESECSATLPVRMNAALNLRKRNIKSVLRHIRQARNVELCFLVDATSSMQPHIDGVKNSVNHVVELLKPSNISTSNKTTIVENLRLSFVAYRDFCDLPQFQILNFTNSVKEFKAFCSQLVAKGGGDDPEDVFGGIQHALELEWSSNYGTKLIFHFADAPCHGRKYYDSKVITNDQYPDVDPSGINEIELFSKMYEKGIDYYFGKINSVTDQMIEIFSRAYDKEITDFDVNDIHKITDSIISAVSISVSSYAKNGIGGKGKKYVIDKKIPNWNFILKFTGEVRGYEMPKSIKHVVADFPLTPRFLTTRDIQIAYKPFACGSERYAFYGRDFSTTIPKDIVLKEYTDSDETSRVRYDHLNQMQTIASFFAQKYNKIFQENSDDNILIEFLTVETVSIPEKNRFYSSEKLLDGSFLRFTNNANYSVESIAEKMKIAINFIWALTAFSHWTYQETNGKMMVVDLQGIITETPEGSSKIVLTDPAIHCTDLMRFGKMNLGKDGMRIFFERHECNAYCKNLNLNIVDTIL